MPQPFSKVPYREDARPARLHIFGGFSRINRAGQARNSAVTGVAVWFIAAEDACVLRNGRNLRTLVRDRKYAPIKCKVY
jgi:hypothetical protein